MYGEFTYILPTFTSIDPMDISKSSAAEFARSRFKSCGGVQIHGKESHGRSDDHVGYWDHPLDSAFGFPQSFAFLVMSGLIGNIKLKLSCAEVQGYIKLYPFKRGNGWVTPYNPGPS